MAVSWFSQGQAVAWVSKCARHQTYESLSFATSCVFCILFIFVIQNQHAFHLLPIFCHPKIHIPQKKLLFFDILGGSKDLVLLVSTADKISWNIWRRPSAVFCQLNGGWSMVIFWEYWGCLVGGWEIDGESVFWFGCHNWPSNGEWCCQICDPKRVHQLEAQKLTFASSHLHKDTESHLWVTGNKVFARHYQLDEFNRCLYQTSSASSQEILPCSCRSASIVGCWMCEAVAVWEGLWQC